MTDEHDDTFEKIPQDTSPIRRLTRDMRKAAALLSAAEARYFVDTYYAMQKNRIRASNQVRAMRESGEPHEVLVWFTEQSDTMERQLKGALQKYVEAHPAGKWVASQKGIGPVIAAGILARIDINRAPTVGHIWRFAGLDPTVEWKANQKRPWNAALKRICWLAGESFVKQMNRDNAFYGQVFKDRKTAETARNLAGEYADQARETLAKKNIGKDTDAYVWYAGCLSAEDARHILDAEAPQRPKLLSEATGDPGSGQPMLPPGRIHERAKRYAVKLFLAHLHEVWYRAAFDREPPLPYPIAHLGHAHKIEPPQPS